MMEPKSIALPLGYSPKMGRLMGIEPTNAGATIRCVNHFATIAITCYTGVAGVEPTSKVLETFVLPLNYTPRSAFCQYMEGERFELPNPEGADLQSAAFSHFATPPAWLRTESNCRHTDLQSVALPTELLSQTRSRRDSNPRSPA